MSNVLTINQIHLSLIWTETLPELLPVVGRDLPMGFLGQRQQYAAMFEQAQARTGSFEPPWVPQTRANRNHFWFYYLGRKMPDDIRGDEAWQNIVPLRGEVATRIRAPELPGGKILDAFFYPHGIAFVYTLILKPAQSFAETIDLIIGARHARLYQVKREGKPAHWMTLDEIAMTTLDDLQNQVMGTGPRRETRSNEPLTIITIIDGTMDRPKPPKPIANRDETHQALHALCSFNKTWNQEIKDLPELKDSAASIKLMPDDHLLYGFERHRVVWFPAHFTTPLPQHHKLSCYHRNLVMLSLQTEMLGRLIHLFTQHVDADTLVPPALLNLVENGASILSRLHGGVEDTYQSWSAHNQIENNGFVSHLTKTRQYLGWD